MCFYKWKACVYNVLLCGIFRNSSRTLYSETLSRFGWRNPPLLFGREKSLRLKLLGIPGAFEKWCFNANKAARISTMEAESGAIFSWAFYFLKNCLIYEVRWVDKKINGVSSGKSEANGDMSGNGKKRECRGETPFIRLEWYLLFKCNKSASECIFSIKYTCPLKKLIVNRKIKKQRIKHSEIVEE